MWIILICSHQQKLEVDALSRKKNLRRLSEMSSSWLGVRLWINYYFISLWYEWNISLRDKFRKMYLTFHMWNELTFLWKELTILWNDLTIDWNNLTWKIWPWNNRIPDLSIRSTDYVLTLKRIVLMIEHIALTILNRSLASPGINFSALINNNVFMLNMYLDCGLHCIL